MQRDQILELIKSPEKILSVNEQERIIDWITFFIYELEEEVADLDFRVDTRMAELAETNSVAKSEILIKLEPTYIERKRKELTLKSLKSYRQNIRRKRDRIVPR